MVAKITEAILEYLHIFGMKNEHDLKRTLGNNIKARRKSRGWSQEKLSELTGISKNSISEIEKARNFARPNTLIRLAKAFETEVYELFKPNSIKPDKYADIIAKYGEEVRDAIQEINSRYLANSEKP